ncbi:hypothetical protein GHK52_09565 [Lactococcus garvieae]|nr:hypothetical protein [Lactococcus garvieae]
MRGIEYRYLENKGDGNHLIGAVAPQFNSQWNIDPATDNYNDSTLDNGMKNWHDSLPGVVRRQVQPVQQEFTGVGPDAHINENWFSNSSDWPSGWMPVVGEPRAFILDFENPNFTDALKNDFAEVDPNGEKKGFALSVAEVNHLSGSGKAFPTMASRTSVGATRTPFGPGHPWLVMVTGAVTGSFNVINFWTTTNTAVMPQYPALILRDQDGAWTSNI